MHRLLLTVILILIPAVAHGWTVNYVASSADPGASGFFSRGSYDFLVRGDAVQVYRLDDNWTYLGVYGQVALPPDFPAVSFLTGFDQVVVTPATVITPGTGGIGTGGGGASIGAPEPLGGWLRPPVKIERGLQLGSAMIATGVLRAAGLAVSRVDTAIRLPHVTVHVWWQCAGMTTLLLLVGLALATRRYALVALALPLALLDNGLRIAVIGLVAEYGGVALAHGWHDWIGVATTALLATSPSTRG